MWHCTSLLPLTGMLHLFVLLQRILLIMVRLCGLWPSMAMWSASISGILIAAAAKSVIISDGLKYPMSSRSFMGFLFVGSRKA